MSDKLQQGRTAARVGDMVEARRLLTAVTQETPHNIEAWLELAGVVESLEEKKACLKNVLTLDPANAQARASLTLLERKLGGETTADPFDKLRAGRRPPTAATLPSDVTGPVSIDSTEVELLYCYRHAKVETGLRCNRCSKPICPKCAQHTPVGFRCPECMREIEDRFYSQVQGNYLNPYDRPPAKPLFTFGLMGAILLVWLVQELAGGSTNDGVLINFGANYGPLILQGEVWRLFTSMFLHIGAQHLAFNLIGLIAFGFEMERLYGRYRFLVIYVLSGLFGSLASFAVQGPGTYSAGASGAIFGVIGMQLAFFLFYRRRMGEFGRQKRNTVLILVGVSLLFGCSGIMPADNYAHLGGFLAGVGLGYLLAPRYWVDPAASPRRIVDQAALLKRWWVPTLGWVTLVSGLWLALSFWSMGWWWGAPLEAEPGGGTLAYGQTVASTLASSEGDLWTFEGQAGQIVTITMNSDDLDAYVGLYDPNDEFLIEDDDSGGASNARIDTYLLPVSGTYTIFAVSMDDQLGTYNLTLTLDGALNRTPR